MLRYRITIRARTLHDADYQRLLQFRAGLRRFLHWSEEQAREAGVTPAHHQLMLAVRGHGDPRGPSIGELAEYLTLRHNSAVGLVDRAEAAGLVKRVPDAEHPGTVRVALTPAGSQRLEALSAAHLDELARLAPLMGDLGDPLTNLPGLAL